MSDPVRRGRPEAAAAIWRWRDEEHASRRRREASKARLGALLRAAFALLVAGAFFYFDRVFTAAIVVSIGSLTLGLAMVSPLGAYRRLERALVTLGEWIGRALTVALLTPVFYGFLAPYGLLFRRGERDAMKRVFEPSRESYWESRPATRSLDKPY